jgi:hypothetical protein
MKEKEVDIAINGKCKSHYRVVLNMDDILNMPSVDIPLDKRLQRDFGMKKKKTYRYKVKCKKNKTCKVKVIVPSKESST